MRMSNWYVPTMRQAPADAENEIYRLMLRAALVRKSSPGIYAYLPHGCSVLKRIRSMIEEELIAAGAQEMALPLLQPQELVDAIPKLAKYAEEQINVTDSQGRKYSLASSFDAVMIAQICADIHSYRQLPLITYQQTRSYRDSRKTSGAFLHARECNVIDIHSFDCDLPSMEDSLALLQNIATRSLMRLGLDYVEAKSAPKMGELSESYKYVVPAKGGDSEYFHCDCGYCAMTDCATTDLSAMQDSEPALEIKEVYTPGCKTVEDVAEFLSVSPMRIIKTICYKVKDRIIAVLVRGDRQIDEDKLKRYLNINELSFATDEEIIAAGMTPGFCGPVGLKGVKIIADRQIKHIDNHVCGGHKADVHLINVCPERDYPKVEYTDLVKVVAGDKCPCCGSPLMFGRGISVAGVTPSLELLTSAANGSYLDEGGLERQLYHCSATIGLDCLMMAVVSLFHDENGLIWPEVIAPYQVEVLPVNDRDVSLVSMSEDVYHELLHQGISAMLDDRQERPGVKFTDADLLGFPLRITMGKKCSESKLLEIKIRATGEIIECHLGEVIMTIKDIILENVPKD